MTGQWPIFEKIFSICSALAMIVCFQDAEIVIVKSFSKSTPGQNLH